MKNNHEYQRKKNNITTIIDSSISPHPITGAQKENLLVFFVMNVVSQLQEVIQKCPQK